MVICCIPHGALASFIPFQRCPCSFYFWGWKSACGWGFLSHTMVLLKAGARLTSCTSCPCQSWSLSSQRTDLFQVFKETNPTPTSGLLPTLFPLPAAPHPHPCVNWSSPKGVFHPPLLKQVPFTDVLWLLIQFDLVLFCWLYFFIAILPFKSHKSIDLVWLTHNCTLSTCLIINIK